MTTRRVSWRRNDEVQVDEHCAITIRGAGLSLVGTILGAEGGIPVRIEYRVLADAAGNTTAVHVRDLRGYIQRTLTLERDAKGNWLVNGVADRALKGCSDVDLGCSPSTVSLPVRRLQLAAGRSRTIRAARVRFPELTIEKMPQTYQRLDQLTYRHAAETFEAELNVDDDGVVTRYAAWQRTGLAEGLDDTAPLDSR